VGGGTFGLCSKFKVRSSHERSMEKLRMRHHPSVRLDASEYTEVKLLEANNRSQQDTARYKFSVVLPEISR
jgi:hypothetical protein